MLEKKVPEKKVYGLAVGDYEEEIMAFVQLLDIDFFQINKSLDEEIDIQKVDEFFLETISTQIKDYNSLYRKIEKGFEIYVFLLEEYDKNIKLPFFYEDALISLKGKKADLKTVVISNEISFSQGEYLSALEGFGAAF